MRKVNSMAKTKMLAAGAAVALTLGVGAGIAAAQTDDPTPTAPTTTMVTAEMHGGDMDAMHAQMCSHMPEGMQAQHDVMHRQMADVMDDMDGAQMGGTMNGGMMMGS
jgi:hypothetical protein